MRVNCVPNRNAIMLSALTGSPRHVGNQSSATLVHGGGHFIYPLPSDFNQAFEFMQYMGAEWLMQTCRFTRTFVHRTKADIVTQKAAAQHPFAGRGSCYKGGAHHCGRCGTWRGACARRSTLQGVTDPTTVMKTLTSGRRQSTQDPVPDVHNHKSFTFTRLASAYHIARDINAPACQRA